MGLSPEKRTTKAFGRFNEGIRWWSSYFCGIEYKFHWRNFPIDSIWITRFRLANFIIYEKVLRVDPRSDGCISYYFICKQIFQLGYSWCEVLHRSWRSFPCVGWSLTIGVCGVVCFRSVWSHSSHRGSTTKFWFLSAGSWSRIRVRVGVRVN